MASMTNHGGACTLPYRFLQCDGIVSPHLPLSGLSPHPPGRYPYVSNQINQIKYWLASLRGVGYLSSVSRFGRWRVAAGELHVNGLEAF